MQALGAPEQNRKGKKHQRQRPSGSQPLKRHRRTNRRSQSLLNAYTEKQIKDHIQSLRSDFSSAFTPQQISKKLQPLLDKMWSHGLPDEFYASVFHQKVDPQKMQLPDYFEVIKNPMDLGTIKEKLEKGLYQTPNMFAKHMRLVFTNAMRYNEKNGWVYNAAEKMLKDFDKGFSNVIRKMQKEAGERKGENVCATCHGEQFQLQAPVLMCNGTCKNKIRRKAPYWTLPGNTKFHWCQNCYTGLGKDPFIIEGHTVVKSALTKQKNDKEITEPWVQCDNCKRWVHQNRIGRERSISGRDLAEVSL